ncbi:hypothetical protein OSB04_017041 [Centaurea solstitialis]|uniref:Thylakoid lumenal 17.4 kDa protein, chloroplastic n=1 Tax=Centaurea solstitialis TaxID=347529 RepID=A0AA38WLP2_9ASTR|nr:hypothetical protein OSB04_017041 [Centaurea solstitialis]
MATLFLPFSHHFSSSPRLSSTLKSTHRPFHLPSSITVNCSGNTNKLLFLVAANTNNSVSTPKEKPSQFKELRNVACGFLAVWALTTTSPVIAANQRLPPLSTDPNRCATAFVGNTIGQANGVYDKAIDLRFCDYTNEKTNLKGKSLAAALMSGAIFDGADMTEVVMSKAYAVGASFIGTDFTNAVLDRVNFGKANLKGASFKNTVLLVPLSKKLNYKTWCLRTQLLGTSTFKSCV